MVKAVATLGFALIVSGLVSFLWIDDPRSLELPADRTGVTIFGLRVTATRLLAFAGAIGIAVAIRAFLGCTTIGLQMRAVANNRELSAVLGIPILRVEMIAWGISGLLAGFTGLMFANLIRLEPVIITFKVIPSIAAALTGRLQNLGLVLVGGLTMGVIESLLTLSPTLKGARPIATFVIAALVLLWLQRGTRLTFGGARLMDRSLFAQTPSGAAGLTFAAFCLTVLPSVAGSCWRSILTSTACFAMAISGVAFMYARLGMVSLTQVGLMGIGGWVTLRLNYLWGLPFDINLVLASLATMVCGWVPALPALRMRSLYLALVVLMAVGGLEILFGTYQFPNGGSGFWGVNTGSSAPFRRPALATRPRPICAMSSSLRRWGSCSSRRTGGCSPAAPGR